jgi:hypothetical protein
MNKISLKSKQPPNTGNVAGEHLNVIAESESIYTSSLLLFTSGPRKMEPGPTYKISICHDTYKMPNRSRRQHVAYLRNRNYSPVTG